MKGMNPAHSCVTRHGILPVRYPTGRKKLKLRYGAFEDSEIKFSCRRSWQVIVRIWLKTTLTGDEVVEILQGIEIPVEGRPRRIGISTTAANDIRWVEKSPLKLYRLKQVVEAGFRFAENFIVEKAEDLQQKALKDLYPTLERLRTYYRQLDANADANNTKKTNAIEAEYRRRLRDEISYVRVKAAMDLIALETISTPVQILKWLLQENGKATEVKAVFNLYDGSLNPPPDRNANSKGDIEIIERGSSQILTNVRINRR